MSKQPCVWVVEIRLGRRWAQRRYFTEKRDAVQDRDSSALWYPHSDYRVAKYVRVEPKKKRSKP